MSTGDSPLETAEAWQSAVNAQDADRLIELSDPDIEIVGPRGVATGHAVLLDWLQRAGIRMTTVRRFAHESAVVILQQATWSGPGVEETTPPQEVASSFRLHMGRVNRVARFDQLDTALDDAGLNTSHEVSGGLEGSSP